MEFRSNEIMHGEDAPFYRSLFKSMGYSDHELDHRPLIGIANTWNTCVPGHFNLNQVNEFVKKGIYSAGGTAVEFGTIGCCDGVAQGHIGMNYILPSREIICNSVEVMVQAHRLDGIVLLDAVQEMYEQKLVTYPRTDSQYLTDEMGESTETLIQMLLGKMPYAEGLEYQPDVSKVLNSKKVSDHHAIIPTMEVAKADIGELKERNRKILYLISARVLTATADPYIYESHKCQITCNYHTFYLTAKKTKQEGFKAIENKLKQFFGVKIEKEEPELDIWAGKHYGPCDSLVSEHFTQPPKQYTEDTLLSAMERAGNEELTEDTEKKGLGTPATRAAIIEKLIQSGFVKREKKNLVPTDDGNVLITVLPDEIKSPKMTAEWEMALNHIAQNTETADEFLNGITELMQELVARYQGISEEKKDQFQRKAKGEVIGKCPRCGADVREGKVNFYCSDRKCAFTLWKNDKFLASQGKKMDKVAAKKFLSKGKIHYKDLVSRKTGRQYEATVEMVDPGEGNVQFNLIFPQR